ncbi:MAG TPA: LysM peptidoglycan-binding domain-containing protein [Opitutales bacterium]|nr:LysM peptidoglycan-binding domain-containing protein [Opitutales bacterium]
MKFTYILSFLVVAVMLLGTGCERAPQSDVPEYQEKQYQRGQQLVKEGRLQEALVAFLKVIHKRSEAPESHLEAGRLYLQTQQDPVAAIYHFRQYLQDCPKSEAAPMVRQMIETAQKQFVRTLPADPLGDDLDRLDLLQSLEVEHAKVKQLEGQVAQLQTKLTALESQSTKARVFIEPASSARALTTATVPSGAASEDIEPAYVQQTHYTVKSGDSLAKISAQVYGTQAKWKDILEANRQVLSSPKDLRPGQVLVIPN